jgi:hypothetical protein
MEKQEQTYPQYTCLACHVAFQNADLQRLHYKSDWHCYNLKRKMANMEPVDAENFAQRLLGTMIGVYSTSSLIKHSHSSTSEIKGRCNECW